MLLGIFQPLSVPSGFSCQALFDFEFVSLLFRLQLEPALPSYIGIDKVTCICNCVLQDSQMETLKLVSKARVTRRGYLGVGYRFLLVHTIRNRIHCLLSAMR